MVLVFTGMESGLGVYRNGRGVWCLQEWKGCLVLTGMGRVFTIQLDCLCVEKIAFSVDLNGKGV